MRTARYCIDEVVDLCLKYIKDSCASISAVQAIKPMAMLSFRRDVPLLSRTASMQSFGRKKHALATTPGFKRGNLNGGAYGANTGIPMILSIMALMVYWIDRDSLL